MNAETLLVVANVSRFAVPAAVDLSRFVDLDLVDVFGCAVFPQIVEKPYQLTVGPYAFYWFEIK